VVHNTGFIGYKASKFQGTPYLLQQSWSKAVIKEMTINKSCAQFASCAKSFIKCCGQYSGVGFTSTSHTGSHKQHKSANKVPKTGWASGQIGKS